MRFLCLFFVLQHPIASSIKVSTNSAEFEAASYPSGIPISNGPKPEMLMPGDSYLPEGVGCQDQPKWTKMPLVTEAVPAKMLISPGWNGFCQSGWSACPDAVANKDYSYYWKSLGPEWVKAAGTIDKAYCAKNGWLTPEYRAMLHNFTALHEKAKEECGTKWNKPEYNIASSSASGVLQAVMGSVRAASVLPLKSLLWKAMTNPADILMSELAAHQAAAWNCAMGDVGCDIFYCNAAYCDKGHGVLGELDQCEGYDKVSQTISA